MSSGPRRADRARGPGETADGVDALVPPTAIDPRMRARSRARRRNVRVGRPGQRHRPRRSTVALIATATLSTGWPSSWAPVDALAASNRRRRCPERSAATGPQTPGVQPARGVAQDHQDCHAVGSSEAPAFTAGGPEPSRGSAGGDRAPRIAPEPLEQVPPSEPGAPSSTGDGTRSSAPVGPRRQRDETPPSADRGRRQTGTMQRDRLRRPAIGGSGRAGFPAQTSPAGARAPTPTAPGAQSGAIADRDIRADRRPPRRYRTRSPIVQCPAIADIGAISQSSPITTSCPTCTDFISQLRLPTCVGRLTPASTLVNASIRASGAITGVMPAPLKPRICGGAPIKASGEITTAPGRAPESGPQRRRPTGHAPGRPPGHTLPALDAQEPDVFRMPQSGPGPPPGAHG